MRKAKRPLMAPPLSNETTDHRRPAPTARNGAPVTGFRRRVRADREARLAAWLRGSQCQRERAQGASALADRPDRGEHLARGDRPPTHRAAQARTDRRRAEGLRNHDAERFRLGHVRALGREGQRSDRVEAGARLTAGRVPPRDALRPRSRRRFVGLLAETAPSLPGPRDAEGSGSNGSPRPPSDSWPFLREVERWWHRTSTSGAQDQSSSNRYWSKGTSQHSAILPSAMRNTPTVCQVRSWPSRSIWPSASCTARWSSASRPRRSVVSSRPA